MSYAVMFPDTEGGKRTDLLPEVTGDKPYKKLLSQSRTILKHRQDLSTEVLNKTVGLNEAKSA